MIFVLYFLVFFEGHFACEGFRFFGKVSTCSAFSAWFFQRCLWPGAKSFPLDINQKNTSKANHQRPQSLWWKSLRQNCKFRIEELFPLKKYNDHYNHNEMHSSFVHICWSYIIMIVDLIPFILKTNKKKQKNGRAKKQEREKSRKERRNPTHQSLSLRPNTVTPCYRSKSPQSKPSASVCGVCVFKTWQKTRGVESNFFVATYIYKYIHVCVCVRV